MRESRRHSPLVVGACRVYRLAIWLYPTEFRRAFGDELVITFRNRVEDVLDDGVLAWLAFAVHIAVDCIRTCSMLITESRTPGSYSLLGLSDRDGAHGCIDDSAVDVALVFVVGGFALSFAGWYAFFGILPLLLS